MAYGQTGAGKTFTLSDIVTDELVGTTVEGIIPRSAADIFLKAETDKDHEYHVSMSYIQIYMEMIQDLLRPENSNLNIRETENGEVYVAGVEEIQVKSVQDVMKLLMIGDQNRNFAFTKLNAHSSRSHTIGMITVEKKALQPPGLRKALTERNRRGSNLTMPEKVLVGKLFLVDLAGSERLKRSGSEGIRATEAMSVNMSLTTLGKCISARADPMVTHVPFRDSKLTRLLQESLGGNAKTSLIVNVAPCGEFLQETFSSLQFGSRAMKVSTRAIVNIEEEFRVITKNLQQALEIQDKRLHSLEAAVLSKEEQLEAARLSLELQTREVEKLRKEQKLRDEQVSLSKKFLEQLKDRDKDWQNRLELLKMAAKDHLIEKVHDQKEEAAVKIQRAYKKYYLNHLQEEKRKVEVVAGSQLMVNSAAKVFKSLAAVDDYFTKKT
ncbi:hypothetical protein O6H91_03G127400 [Diphasiastrum complanatum]|nr:hypothetical protein O6H91_03G127400 [Diphasiastrum complanatum]